MIKEMTFSHKSDLSAVKIESWDKVTLSYGEFWRKDSPYLLIISPECIEERIGL